ncbi:MAG: metal-dependent hydrolase [Candidatus Geothermarchaeales archaeon]
MKIRWLGHAAFEVEAKEARIYIDPFLTNNPKAPMSAKDIEKADLIFITHDHFDHFGDALDIAKRTGATVVAVPELASVFEGEGVPALGINLGSFTEIKGVKVALVQAFHTCDKGEPAGVLFEAEGKIIYHLGDTALSKDLEVISELYEPEIALIPIGGFYTMGPREAAKAVELLKPKVAIPMHYGTFPVLRQDPKEFISEAQRLHPDTKIVPLKPGESYQT